MKIPLFTIICITILLSSCQKQLRESYNPDLIKRKEINQAFGTDVSNVLFDHLYVVVDSTTYAQVTGDNQWQDTYASLDGGLPDFAPLSNTSSTCYLRGHQHSIEILGPNNSYNEPIGKSGIGFSLKNKGEHFHLGVTPKLRALKDSLLTATETVKMEINGQDHTWFKAFYTPSPGTALHTWYAFYNPKFLDQLNDEEHSSYLREDFLASSYADHKLFHGINVINLKCTQADFNRIAQELGYLKSELLDREGNMYIIKSGDVKIVLEPSRDIAYSRITKITCKLNNTDNSVSQLGNITITNSGKVSTWDFNELHLH